MCWSNAGEMEIFDSSREIRFRDSKDPGKSAVKITEISSLGFHANVNPESNQFGLAGTNTRIFKIRIDP